MDGDGPAEDRQPSKHITADNPLGFVLDRELSEVHLLLDYISSRNDKGVPKTLTPGQNGAEDDGWLVKLCEITWPPDDLNSETFERAALLIRAKDALNRVAYPANGATVAFTMLVTQEDNSASGKKPGVDTPSSRNSLSRTAYPGLTSKAKNFRWCNNALSIFISAWLIGTCWLSWYVAIGNSLLVQFATAKSAYADVVQRVTTEEAGSNDGADPPVSPSGTKTPPTNLAEPDLTAMRGHFIALCDRSRLLDTSKAKSGGRPVTVYSSVNEEQLCNQEKDLESEFERAGKALAKWHHVPFTPDPQLEADGAYASASAWASVIGSAVLPVLYGFLGAGAAVVRAISRKTSANLLSPRDLPLSLQQLALGAIVGACIGLFVNPQTASSSGGASLLGPVALSSSALSFIAGFGVEGVFRAMEALINRVFGGGAGSQSTPQPKPAAVC